MTLNSPVRTVVAAVAASVFGLPAYAAAQDIPEFNKLRTPTSPAFVILGITPAEIERPTRPSAFAASFLQRIEDATKGKGLPSNWAIDVAPYWLRHHPELTFASYASAGGLSNIYRDATISFAVTDSLGDGSGAPADDASFRRVGLGFRTTLLAAPVADTARACVRVVSLEAARVAQAIAPLVATDSLLRVQRSRLPNDLRSRADTLLRDSIQTRASKLADPFVEAQGERLGALAKKCTEQLSARHGFNIDAALAGAVDFPGGRANAGDFSRFGAWITPAWLGTSFSHVGVLRLTLADVADVETPANTGTVRTIDVGLRSVYAWQRFAVSSEAVFRNVGGDVESRSFARVAAIFDAKLTDQNWLTLTFGKDFDATQPQSLIAIFGLKWQIGEQRVKPDVAVP